MVSHRAEGEVYSAWTIAAPHRTRPRPTPPVTLPRAVSPLVTDAFGQVRADNFDRVIIRRTSEEG